MGLEARWRKGKRRTKALLERPIGVALLSWSARAVLRAHRPLVIGITGSVGKTTTKETLAAVLMHPEAEGVVGRVAKTPGNMNCSVGLPLTILGYSDWLGSGREWLAQLARLPWRTLRLARSKEYPQVLVLEYGAQWKGSVARKARIAPPTVAIVTEVGPAHLDGLGSVEGVAEEKAALVRAVPATGLVVLNADNPHVSAMAAQSKAPVVKVTGRGVELSRNITRAVARRLGLSDGMIEGALAQLPPIHRRLVRERVGSIELIDDSFNANPLSMKLGLEVLEESARPGQRRVAVLGTMAELGTAAAAYHREVGAYAHARCEILIGVGALSEHYRPDSRFDDSAACAAGIAPLLRPGDCVLVKGSAAVGLQRVVHAIKAAQAQQPDERPL